MSRAVDGQWTRSAGPGLWSCCFRAARTLTRTPSTDSSRPSALPSLIPSLRPSIVLVVVTATPPLFGRYVVDGQRRHNPLERSFFGKPPHAQPSDLDGYTLSRLPPAARSLPAALVRPLLRLLHRSGGLLPDDGGEMLNVREVGVGGAG